MGWEERADALTTTPAVASSGSNWEKRLAELDAPKVGLSGPGSKDDSPSAPITTSVPIGPSDIPGAVATGAVNSVKSFARGASKLHDIATEPTGNSVVDNATGLGPVQAIVNVGKTLANPSKRRELERGVSDVVTLGMAERAANLFPDYAATAKTDAENAPGYREAGGTAGTFLPNPIGAVAGIATKAAGKAIAPITNKIVGAAGDREIGRAAEEIIEGSSKKNRMKLVGNAIEDDGAEAFHRVLKEEPELLATAGKGDPTKARAAEYVTKKGGKDLDAVYAEADVRNGAKPVAEKIIKQAEVNEARAAEIAKEIETVPVNSEAHMKLVGEMQAAKLEGRALRRQAATEISTQTRHGIVTGDVVTTGKNRIAELRKGTASDLATADKLEDLMKRFNERYPDRSTVIPAKELRKWQSDFQDAGYGKALPGDAAASATIAANQEASKVIGDPLIKHVTGLDYQAAKRLAEVDPNSIAARLFRANEKVAIGKRIISSLAAKAPTKPGFHLPSVRQVVNGAVNMVPSTVDKAIVNSQYLPNMSSLSAIGAIKDADNGN